MSPHPNNDNPYLNTYNELLTFLETNIKEYLSSFVMISISHQML